MAETESKIVPKLASAGNDIKVWNTSDYSVFCSFGLNFSPWFQSVHWSPDISHLVSVPSSGDKLYFHLVKTGGGLQHADFRMMKETCTIAIFSSTSSRFLGIGTKTGNVQLWDIKYKKSIKSFQTTGEVTSLDFNWNDSYMTSGSSKGTITVHNCNTCRSNLPMSSEGLEAIRCLQYSHLKKALIASSSDDGGIRLWDANVNQLIRNFGLHFTPATSLRFSPVNTRLLVSVGLDKQINVLDVQSKRVVHMVECESPITSLDFKYDGLTIAVGSSRGKVYIYDVRALKTPQFIFAAHKSSVSSLSFQPSTIRAGAQMKPDRLMEEKSQSEVKFDLPYRTPTDIVNSASVLNASSGLQMQAFMLGRQKQSLTSEILSPLRDFSRSSSGLLTPVETDLIPGSPSLSVKRRIGKRSALSKKYSLDIFSPVNESAYEKTDEKSRTGADISISYDDSAIIMQKFETDSLKEEEPSEEHRDCKVINTESQFEFTYNEDSETATSNNLPLATEDVLDKKANERKFISLVTAANDDELPKGNGSEMKFTRSNPEEFQAEYLRNIFMDTIEDCSDTIRKEFHRMHVQMCRQHQELQDEMEAFTVEIKEMMKKN